MTVSELICAKVFEAFVILLAILLTTKSTVESTVFWIALFQAVLSVSVVFVFACFSMIKNFLPIFTALVVTDIFAHSFSKRQKPATFYKYSINWFTWIAYHILYFKLYNFIFRRNIYSFLFLVILLLALSSNFIVLLFYWDF